MSEDALRTGIPGLATHTEAEFGGRKLVLDALGMTELSSTFCWKNVGVPNSERPVFAELVTPPHVPRPTRACDNRRGAR